MSNAGNPDKRIADLQKRVRLLEEVADGLRLWKQIYMDSVKEVGIPVDFEHYMRSTYQEFHTINQLKGSWQGADGDTWRKLSRREF